MELDLDAVTMAEQPRVPFICEGHHICDWSQSTDIVTIFVGLGPGMKARHR